MALMGGYFGGILLSRMGFGACMLMQQLQGQCIESPDQETSP